MGQPNKAWRRLSTVSVALPLPAAAHAQHNLTNAVEPGPRMPLSMPRQQHMVMGQRLGNTAGHRDDIQRCAAPAWSASSLLGDRLDNGRHAPSLRPPCAPLSRPRGRRAHHRQASTREPTPRACVTTAVRRLPRDQARQRAPGTPVATALDTPMPVSVGYAKRCGAPRSFPLSAGTAR